MLRFFRQVRPTQGITTMAKPPGERTKLIRQAITDRPGVGNAELAKLLNEQKPGHDIKASDIAQQKQAMKNLQSKGAADDNESDTERKREGPRQEAPATSQAAVGMTPASVGLTTDDLATLGGLARKVGGVDALIRYLELLRDIR